MIIDSDPSRRENRRALLLNCPCRPMEQYPPTTGQSLTAWPGAGDHRISRVDATAVRHSVVGEHAHSKERAQVQMELWWINDSLSGLRT